MEAGIEDKERRTMSKHKKAFRKKDGTLKNPSRRKFVNQAFTLSMGAALSNFLPRLNLSAVASCNVTPAANELKNPGEIVSDPATKLLKAVMRVKDESRTVPGFPNPYTLRAYLGYKGHVVDPKNLVTNPKVYGPGPTLRAEVGDTLQIALLNHISPAQFPETQEGACDVTHAPTCEIYPGNPTSPAQRDEPPDCFRGSNHTNLHFHGTHVSPNAFSDNVLISIAPDLAAKAEDCDKWWKYACQDYPNPQAWKHLPPALEAELQRFINENQSRLRLLPKEKFDPQLHIREADENKKLMEYNEFPQFWRGCFPYCIRPPKKTPSLRMGQAPGTHWYHAHKHGSTSIQVYNGMAGALILEGDYDKKLKETMPGVEQKIMVFQQFSEQPNKETTGGAGATCTGSAAARGKGYLVNGQSVPTITMQTGEVQWWRLIDASVQGNKGAFIPVFTGGIQFRQIAQDGVQFAWANYHPQIANPPTNFLLAPGNRVDILVKAPNSPGSAVLQLPGSPATVLVNVNVVSGSGCNTVWPETENQFPKQPDFLDDITTWSETRTLKYQMCAQGSTPTINGKKFEEGIVDESMLLDTKQEWTIENFSTATAKNPLHPFHIHINPFQIVEIFDPTGSLSATFGVGKGAMFGDWSKIKTNPNGSISLPAPWVWWDTFPLPLGKTSSTASCPADKDVTPGYIKFRTWFADFAGKFVDHCHILAHEDRGMMQLVEVVDNHTPIRHH